MTRHAHRKTRVRVLKIPLPSVGAFGKVTIQERFPDLNWVVGYVMVSYRDIPFGDGLEKPLFFTHDLLFEKNRTNIVFIVQRTQKIFTKFAMRI